MKLTLTKSDDSDWYLIERAEHDGHGWMEPTEYGAAFRWSGRFSDADVEGTGEEMLAIAQAIEERGSACFKRCSVHVIEAQGVARFSSPRNSMHDGECTLAEADALAVEIRTKVAT